MHVWGDTYEGDPNIVEVYVGYLRKKIDQPFRNNRRNRPRGRLPARPSMVAEGVSSPRLQLSSVRVRVMAVAIVVVGLTFAVGGLALELQLQHSSVSTVSDLTVSEASDVAAVWPRGPCRSADRQPPRN